MTNDISFNLKPQPLLLLLFFVKILDYFTICSQNNCKYENLSLTLRIIKQIETFQITNKKA